MIWGRRRFTAPCLGAVAALLMLGAGSAVAAAKKPVSLGLAAPSQIAPDQGSIMSGRLINRSNRHVIVGARIRFYFAPPGAKSWKFLGTALTNGQGVYRTTINVPATAAFTTYFAGSRRFRSARSPTRWVDMPADGSMAWNAHYNCHYTVGGGVWRGDFCAAYQTNTSGAVVRNIVNIYAYDPHSAMRAGALQYQLNTAFPGWMVWRVPSDPEFQTVLWAAVPQNNPTAEPKLWVDFQGKWQWITKSGLIALIQQLEAIVAAQGGGTPPASSNIVTVAGSPEGPWAFTDLANGVDKLGGNAQLGQAFSNIYSLATMDPVTLGVCGEYDWTCYPLP